MIDPPITESYCKWLRGRCAWLERPGKGTRTTERSDVVSAVCSVLDLRHWPPLSKPPAKHRSFCQEDRWGDEGAALEQGVWP